MSDETLAVATQVKTDTTAIKAKTDLISAGHNAVATSLVGAVSYNAAGCLGYLNPIGSNTAIGYSTIASGALTADTYKSVLSISGSGVFKTLGVNVVDTTARTISCKIVLDAVEIYEGSLATTSAGGGIVPLPAMMGFNLVFNTSLDIQIKSTITETDKVNTNVNYYLT